MRHTKTLLKIVRDNLEKSFKELELAQGICGVTHHSAAKRLITEDEKLRILIYLNHNKPDFAKQREHDLEGQTDIHNRMINYYWWTPGEVEPRINWLNEQINKL